MNIKRSLLYGLMFGVLTLAGCGGGGGTAAPQTSTATLKLSTSGTLAPGISLAGIGITVILPAGVTVRTDAGGAVASGVVTVSGATAGTVISVYTPASGGIPATLALAMVSIAPIGFGTGEFITITCDRASGISPQAADFPLTGFNPFDLGGNPVAGLTPSVAVVLN